MTTVTAGQCLSFVGPYSWGGEPDAPSLFGSEAGGRTGIYLWTVRLDEGFLTYYVGQTGRPVEVRMLEHYKEHAACLYHLNSPKEFAAGRRVVLWPGRYDAANRKSIAECVAAHPQLAATIAELSGIYRFFVAPFDGDTRVRERIEAGLAGALLSSDTDQVREFQEAGIRYRRRKEGEVPLTVSIVSPAPLVGIPAQIEV